MRLKRPLATLAHSAAFTSGLLVLLACLVLPGMPAFAAAPPHTASVRFIQAAPGAGGVDVFINGRKVLSNFDFGKVTPYAPTPAGSYRVQVAPTGKGVGASIINQMVSVTAGDWYTDAALGTKATGYSLAWFMDNNHVASNMATVRVYHLSPNAGPVNVATGGKTVITDLTYKHDSGYLTLAPGSHTFDVTATQSRTTMPVSSKLSAGTVNCIFAVGLLKGSPALQFVQASTRGVA